MRLAMRVLVLVALPGLVFGWVTRLQPLRFELDTGFAPEAGWIDVLAAMTIATVVVALVAVLVIVLIKLDIGADRQVGRHAKRQVRRGA